MRATEKLGKVNEECLNCRNYMRGICGGIKGGKCRIVDHIHKQEKDWWEK